VRVKPRVYTFMTLIDDQMKLAVGLARSGEKDRAQFVFTQIVAVKPDHVHAWLWLSELSSDLVEQTAMLEQAMKYLPDGADGCKDLQSALNEIHDFIPLPPPSNVSVDGIPPKKINENEMYQQAERLMIVGNKAEALKLVKAMAEAGAVQERTWLLDSDLSETLAEKIAALEKALAINANNEATRRRLDTFRQAVDRPLEAGRYLEDCGEMDQAIALYQSIAAQSVSIEEQARARECISRLAKAPAAPGVPNGSHAIFSGIRGIRGISGIRGMVKQLFSPR
jgi:tetratricopeptide (TPR) repeat protein